MHRAKYLYSARCSDPMCPLKANLFDRRRSAAFPVSAFRLCNLSGCLHFGSRSIATSSVRERTPTFV